jgi:S1-C subfamily serine protease
MKRCLLALGLAALAASSEASRPGVPAKDPSRSIVKVYVSRVLRDVNAPWRSGWNWGVTGSGAWIEGGRILTAAHVVDDQSDVRPDV